jgi:hypothetical protein
MADSIIKEIAESGDIIGRGRIAADHWSVPVTFLLLALEPWAFRDLCEYGAALADDEDTHDAEPEVDEHTLGRTERLAQPEEQSSEDREPSLGSLAMTDQQRWNEGGSDSDSELDLADREPSLASLGQTDQQFWSQGDNRDLEPSVGRDDREEDPAEMGEPDERRWPRIREAPAAAPDSSTIVPAVDPDGRAGAWLLLPRSLR